MVAKIYKACVIEYSLKYAICKTKLHLISTPSVPFVKIQIRTKIHSLPITYENPKILD